MVRPFEEVIVNDNEVIRIFDSSFPANTFQWHKDDEDRMIEIVETGHNWEFQFDNEIPFALTCSTTFLINKGVWHRIIPGNDTLTVKIYKKR